MERMCRTHGPTRRPLGCRLLTLVVGWALSGCNHLVLEPILVVPTNQPVPYSARVQLAEVGAYLVQSGATMIADPSLQNHVIAKVPSAERAQPQWEEAIREYVLGRRTFRQVVKEGPADLSMTLRVFIYVDPSTSFTFNHIYVAKVDGALRDPHSGRVLLDYVGTGQAVGAVSRGGQEDDRELIN